jgi:hypothetical protein
MKKQTEALLELFKKNRMSPTTSVQRVNGTVLMVWYVDNDDDRFILLIDSVRTSGPRANETFIVLRDGHFTHSIVVDELDRAVSTVITFLNRLFPNSQEPQLVRPDGQHKRG